MTQTTTCRHDFKCEGWTIDETNSTCRVCGLTFVFWLEDCDPMDWEIKEPGGVIYVKN